LNNIIQREQRLWQIKLPLPYPLQWVNAYVLQGRGGFDVVDPGLHTEATEQLWEVARTSIGFSWNDVRSIIITHHHPDHYGMAGWLQQRTGATVHMSHIAHDLAELQWGQEQATNQTQVLDFFMRHGLPATEQSEMRNHFIEFVDLVTPRPTRIKFIRDRESILLGDSWYESLHTPGHAAGHLSFIERDRGHIFCGDHVIPGISPNVSLLPFGDPDPLATYLDSLKVARTYPVTQAYPGHRESFTNYSERTQTIYQHHLDRLTLIEATLSAPSTAYQLCRKLFGERLSIHQLRFALSETLAHLIYLERRGRVRMTSDEPLLLFQI
jgi:glyoxylase-like metal-dependent hydrolase (beta-lactamase superfamily II)